MRSRLIAVVLAATTLLLAVPAQAAPPASVAVADPAGDQTPNALWDKYPGQRASADLRRAVFAVENAEKTLRLTLTFAASPTSTRVYQNLGMSTTLGGKQLTFSAYRRADGSVYTFAYSPGADGASIPYCAGKMTVAVNQTAKTVTMRIPIACLPAGKVLRDPYPTGSVTVLRAGTQDAEGNVASDWQSAAPDLTIR